jgi:hypothetical protein
MSTPPSSQEPPAWAQNMMENMMGSFQLLRERMDALEAGARDSAVTETINPTPLDSTVEEQAPTRRVKPRPCLPETQTFSGDRIEWPAWKIEMTAKLTTDAEAIGGDKAMFYYINSRLAGTARRNVAAYVAHERERAATPWEFLDHLETLYGDHNLKQRAAQRLHALRQQPNQTFAKFYPLFEKEMADAEATTWSNPAKTTLLINAVNEQMKQALVTSELPSMFKDLVNVLHNVSARMEVLGAWKKQPATGTAGRAKEDETEWESPDTVRVNAARGNGRRQPINAEGYPSTRPEDKDLIGKRAQWVSNEVRDQRREEGRCLRCGRDGCRLTTCPLKMAVPPARGQASRVNTSRPKVSTAKVEEEEDIDDHPSQEKE